MRVWRVNRGMAEERSLQLKARRDKMGKPEGMVQESNRCVLNRSLCGLGETADPASRVV